MLTLEYLADHFPEYSHAKEHAEDNPKYLLSTLAQDFLDNSGLPANTRKTYRQHLNAYVMPALHNVDVRRFTEVDVVSWDRTTEFTSEPVRNIALSALRKVLDLAVQYQYISSSPGLAVAMVKESGEEPDPLSAQEREKVLAYLRSKYTGKQRPLYLYNVIGFWTGMRPGEIIALNKGDVVLETGKVRVSKTLADGKVQEYTKTKKARFVLMNEFSRPAFEELLEYGCNRRSSDRLLWTTRAPDGYHSMTRFRDRLSDAFEECGVESRSTYSMRHTYASTCLMAGMTPAFVAGQLGNTVQVLLKNYARWISSDADAAEMAKLGK